MSDSDIARILAAIDELKVEVVALKAWQTQREQAEHDRAVRLDAYRGVYRWALLAWRNDFVKFALALSLAGGGTRLLP